MGKATEKVEFNLRSTWAVGQRIFQAEGRERARSTGRTGRQAMWLENEGWVTAVQGRESRGKQQENTQDLAGR